MRTGSTMGRLAIGSLCGTLGACLYLALLMGSPGALILVYLTQLPLFLAGLWLGVGAAVAAGLTASLILLAASDVIATVLFAGLYAVPVVLLVRQALLARTGSGGTIEWYPPGLLTGWLTGLGLAAIAVVIFLLGDPDGVQAVLREALAPVLDRLFDESAAERDKIAGVLAVVIPGTTAASWMVMTATNASLAQGLLVRFGASWRPSPDLAALGLPIWVPILFAGAAASVGFGDTARFLGINVLILLAVPFCLAGLAVLHTIARRFARPAIPLVAFYALAGLFGWPLVLIALLGLLDSSLGLRHRFARPHSVGGKIDG